MRSQFKSPLTHRRGAEYAEMRRVNSRYSCSLRPSAHSASSAPHEKQHLGGTRTPSPQPSPACGRGGRALLPLPPAGEGRALLPLPPAGEGWGEGGGSTIAICFSANAGRQQAHGMLSSKCGFATLLDPLGGNAEDISWGCSAVVSWLLRFRRFNDLMRNKTLAAREHPHPNPLPQAGEGAGHCSLSRLRERAGVRVVDQQSPSVSLRTPGAARGLGCSQAISPCAGSPARCPLPLWPPPPPAAA